MSDYYVLLTKAGAELEAAAHAAGKPVKLKWIAVGDGGGTVPVPQVSATALVHEVWRGQIDTAKPDPDDPAVTWFTKIIPADVGGFWIRELGFFAEGLNEGDEPVLYAYGDHAPYYKILPGDGQAVTHELSIPLILSGTAQVQIVMRESGYATVTALQDALAKIKLQEKRIKTLEDFVVPRAGACKKIYDGMDEDGWVPLNGALIPEISRFPEMIAYLQGPVGSLFCITEEEWQALSQAIYHTNADGTVVGWNGIGGVKRFVLDLIADTLRLPDLRGMHEENVGGGLPSVLAVDGDRMRKIYGNWDMRAFENGVVPTGASFWLSSAVGLRTVVESASNMNGGLSYDTERIIPTGQVTAPKRYAVQTCVFLGKMTS